MNLLELTTPYIEKIIDPALMTYEEYYKLVNEKNKNHPSTAYDEDCDFSYFDLSKFKVINTITINGLLFKIYIQQFDKWKENKYVKKAPDGSHVRDENGNIVYFTPDELEKLNYVDRYQYNYAVVDVAENKIIGGIQDEWGCMLVHINKAYRSFGLGQILLKLAYSTDPKKPSGGFTPGGYKTFFRIYQSFVSDYLKTGTYSHLIKQGIINTKRVQDIVSSARLQNKPKEKENIDLSSNNPANWVLYTDGDGEFILYDKNLKELRDNTKYDQWIEKTIKGHIYATINERHDQHYAIIKQFYGVTPKLKTFMLMLILSWCKKEKISLRNDILWHDEDILPFLDKTKINIKNKMITLNTDAINYEPMQYSERKWRKSFDQHDEFKLYMQELAYSQHN